MLRSVPAAASLVVCSTCRLSKESRTDPQGSSGGELFVRALSDALASHVCRDRVALQSMPCLYACDSHCTVFLRSGTRLGYVLGRFAPVRGDAVALLDYIEEYLASDDGIVRYARWPDGVKGHFLVRVPPDGSVWTASA